MYMTLHGVTSVKLSEINTLSRSFSRTIIIKDRDGEHEITVFSDIQNDLLIDGKPE